MKDPGADSASTIAIIQARMGSDRLPGKILAPLAGRPLLARLFARIEAAGVDGWWLATSSDPADDVTEAWGFELGLRVYRGHPTDVLSRFLAIAEETSAEWIVRVTADNPFLDAAVIDALLAARDGDDEAKRADTLRHRGGLPPSPTTTAESEPAQGARAGGASEPAAATPPRLPVGYGVELVRASALARAAETIPADQAHHRVHVTSWLSLDGDVHYVPTPAAWPDRPDWRWTVDTYEDLAMARSAFRVFGAQADTIDYPTMVACLDAHPEIVAMNRHIAQKKLEEG